MSSPKQNVIGRRLQRMRTQAEPPITQDELSARLSRLGVSIDRAGISKIENGSRSVCDFELVALAKVLRVSCASLLGVP